MASKANTLGAAVLVATAVLAGAAEEARGQANPIPEETAMAVSRPLLPGVSRSASLPAILAPSDAARLRRLFMLQANGQIAAAIRETAALDSAGPEVEGVLGHLLADRHLGPHTRTAGADLHAWLARWPDLPDAPAIHALLSRRLAAGQTLPPPPPRAAILAPAPPPDAAEDDSPPQTDQPPRRAELGQAVRDAARTGGTGAAARALRAAGPIPPPQAALLRGEAAQILFARNRDREALDLAAPAAATAALAGHWAGLAAWRLDQVERAAALFQAAWQADIATPAQRAAAAFWAARAHQRAADPARHALWLSFAAQEPRSFHGLIARHMLGLTIEDSGFPRDTLADADLAAVAAHPGGLRALALIQIGQRDRAEAELRQLWPAVAAAPGLGRALMLVADHAGLDSLAVQLADRLAESDERPRSQAARIPVPRLRPSGGFTADPALVFAIARVESNFDSSLVSRAGARGLMQLMPGTARFLAGIPAGTEEEPAPLPALHDPAVNLSLGQRYLHFLATTEAVGGDKLRLLAAYNAGPSAMTRWAAAIRDHGDPFLFLEAIPVDETRAFIPRVLTHTWLYAHRMRLPMPSLDELAAGQWPRYVLPDRTVRLH